VSNTALIDPNTVFTNTAPLIFGTPSTPVTFGLGYFDSNREITIYVSGNTLPSAIYCGNFTPTYDKLNIIQVGTSPATISVSSPATWAPIFNIPLTQTTVGSKNLISSQYTPRQYTFGITGNISGRSVFSPTINLVLPTNLNAGI